MHQYLRAIGFSNVKSVKDVNKLVIKSINSADKRAYTSIDNYDIDSLYSEYFAKFGKRIGLCVRGEFSDENVFSYEYYFPYLEGNTVTTYEDISVEQHIEKMSFAGIVDELNIGVSVIFYLQNIITYLKLVMEDRLPIKGTSLTLTALSKGGKILLPIDKTELQAAKIHKFNARKSRMIAEAKRGNENAIEDLTIQDMDTYSVIRKKMKDEDVYSIVDTSFMPYGVECDLYAIIGEIVAFEEDINTLTHEKVYVLTLNVNDIVFDICINSVDLVGAPEVGRRFKGVIWMQGHINFPEDI